MDNFLIRFTNGKDIILSRGSLVKFIMNYSKNLGFSISPFIRTNKMYSHRFEKIFNQSAENKPEWANIFFFSLNPYK